MSAETEFGLCDVCLLYFANNERNDYHDHHRTVHSFVQAVENGCYLCDAFVDAFSVQQRKALLDASSVADTKAADSRRPFMKMAAFTDEDTCQVCYMGPMDDLIQSVDVTETWTERLVPQSENYVPIQSPRISISDAVESIKVWLQTCEQHHTACNACDELEWYPPRLLDLRPEVSNDLVKLVCTSEFKISGNYWTLSHCWADGDFMQLNSVTKSMLVSGITLDKLPQTFKDAIELCRSTGVRYIWIDSLCIQQDDPMDWLNQSKNMGKVYSSAQCNVSADACSSSKEGLFRDRDPVALRRRTIKIPDESTILKPGKYDIFYLNSYLYKLGTLPVNKRAWVVQERMLAKRVLHFTHSEIYWECGELAASEAFPAGIRWERSRKSLGPERYGTRNTDSLYSYWRSIVSDYSSTLITYPDDRPIAISGIAKMLMPLLQDEYIVGMWRRTLISDLNWRDIGQSMGDPRRVSTKECKYQVPSFSWLSVDTSITLTSHERVKQILAEVVDISLEYVTDDVTGLVRGGKLWLKGALRQLHFKSGISTRVQSVVMRPESNPLNIGLHTDLHWNEFWEIYWQSTPKVYILPLLETGPLSRGDVEGLMLQQVSTDSSTFRRIGHFHVLSWTFEKDVPDIFEKQEGEDSFPCENYDRETSRHTICIQ